MRARSFHLSLLLITVGTATAALPPAAVSFLETHCYDCHDADAKKGGLDLTALKFDLADEAAFARWVQVHDVVREGEMPPKKKARPEAEELKAFLGTLDPALSRQHAAVKGTRLRRLNRTEYENALADLLGVRVAVRDLLPEDSLSHGFDNIGSALSVSAVQMERYLQAAEFALDAVLTRKAPPERTVLSSPAGNDGLKNYFKRPDGSVTVFGYVRFPNSTPRSFRVPSDGHYEIRITGSAYQSDQPMVFGAHSGLYEPGTPTELLGYFSLAPGQPQTITIPAHLRAGESVKFVMTHEVTAAERKLLVNDQAEQCPAPGITVQSIEIDGPIHEQWPPRGLSLLLGDLLASAKEGEKRWKNGRQELPLLTVTPKAPEADAARLLHGFATAAFRRPVDDAKVAPYVALAREELQRGAPFVIALRTAAAAILCSPDFLYLREPVGRLDDFALATRLSLFLTRTTPDAELLDLAAKGRLSDAATLRAQTERLLSHPQAAHFVRDFTDAWLKLRDIDFTMPDKRLYPEFDGELKAAMLDESRAFFTELLKENLGPENIVASDFAMLNERLAEHYGIDGVRGTAVRKVALPPGSRRGGVMTQGAVLKVTANGANTSPVVRGAWVLEHILGVTPSPPPPGIPGLEPDIRGATTLREQLDKHRNMESCNGCHRVIDPPGFALESYDVIGGWRERFRVHGTGPLVDLSTRGRTMRVRLGPPVDASGELPDGRSFGGFADFQKLLLAEPDRITHNITEKLLTFASGRELGFSDRPEIERIVHELSGKRGGMRDLIHLIVRSDIFQTK